MLTKNLNMTAAEIELALSLMGNGMQVLTGLTHDQGATRLEVIYHKKWTYVVTHGNANIVWKFDGRQLPSEVVASYLVEIANS